MAFKVIPPLNCDFFIITCKYPVYSLEETSLGFLTTNYIYYFYFFLFLY